MLFTRRKIPGFRSRLCSSKLANENDRRESLTDVKAWNKGRLDQYKGFPIVTEKVSKSVLR